MKFSIFPKQISRREMLEWSTGLAGGALLTHLFSGGSQGVSAADNTEQAPSPADLLASMRAKFNAVPMQTQKLADNVTMFDGPGGAVVVLDGPDGKFVVDTFVEGSLNGFRVSLGEIMRRAPAVLVFLFLGLSTFLLAQSTNASLTGRVTDPC